MKKSELTYGTEVCVWGRDFGVKKADVLHGRKAIHAVVPRPLWVTPVTHSPYQAIQACVLPTRCGMVSPCRILIPLQTKPTKENPTSWQRQQPSVRA